MRFEWDEKKAEANLRKHGVSFEEAKSAIYDPLSFTIRDLDHSIDENRWITTGYSEFGRILVVCATLRGKRIRIISARKATTKETKNYESPNAR